MVISAVLLSAVLVANCGKGLGHLKDGSLLACSHSNCRAPHHMRSIHHHLVPDISGLSASFSCSAAPAAGTLPAGQIHLHSMKTANHTSSPRQPADTVKLSTKSIYVAAICRHTQTNNRSQVPASSTAVDDFLPIAAAAKHAQTRISRVYANSARRCPLYRAYQSGNLPAWHSNCCGCSVQLSLTS